MNIESFKNQINIGDIFILPTKDTGFTTDFLLPETLEFIVHKKRNHTVELHHIIRNNKLAGIHIYSPNYVTLYLLTHTEGNNE